MVYIIGLLTVSGCLMLMATRFLLLERTVPMVQTENLVQMAQTVLTDSRVLPERMVSLLSSKWRTDIGIFHMTMETHGSSLERLPVRTERMAKTVRTERTAKTERMEWMVIPCSRMWMPAIRTMCCSYSATALR